jgi:hypothetical protein
MMNGHDIPGGSVTAVLKGFMNASLFEKRLSHFHLAVPETTRRQMKWYVIIPKQRASTMQLYRFQNQDAIDDRN